MSHGTDDYALVIGINGYPNWAKGKRSLSGAVNDAERFREWLISADGGGLVRDNARLILSTEQPVGPLQAMIDDELEIILKNSNGKKRRRLYFFFSGHGYSPAMSAGVQALCLANWSLERPGAALHFESYFNTSLGCFNFEEGLFFLDCCRVQEVAPIGQPSELACANPTPKGPRITFYAAEAYEAGYEGPEAHGYFGNALVNILNEGTIESLDLEHRLNKDVTEAALKDGKKQIANTTRTAVIGKLFLGPPLGPAPPEPSDSSPLAEALLTVKLMTHLASPTSLGEPPPPAPGAIVLYRNDELIDTLRGHFEYPDPPRNDGYNFIRFERSLPLGEYTLHITHGEAIESRSIDLLAATTIDNWFLPQRNSAALLSSTRDKQEFLTDPVVAASRLIGAPEGNRLHPQSVFIVHRQKDRPFDGEFNGKLWLDTRNGPHSVGASRSLIPVEPGTFTLRFEAPDQGELCLTVPVVAGWDTQLFFVEDEGRPILERASILMRPAGSGFEPTDALLDAYELALADLVSGAPGPNEQMLEELLSGKFKNPLFGLVGAHFLLRNLQAASPLPEKPPYLLNLVIDNMGRLLGPQNADVVALKLLRAKLFKQDEDITTIDGPPLLRASLLALIEATATRKALFNDDLDEMALGILPYSPWCCWRETESTVELSGRESYLQNELFHDLTMPYGPRINSIEKILSQESFSILTDANGPTRRIRATGRLSPDFSNHIAVRRMARTPDWVVDEMRGEIERANRHDRPLDLASAVSRLSLPRGLLEQALRIARQNMLAEVAGSDKKDSEHNSSGTAA